MKIVTLSIKNYRALREVEIPFSNFVCLTGENNSGKSSFLLALSLFLSGGALSPSDFFEPDNEVTVTLEFDEVTAADLDRLVPEHRAKIDPLVVEGKLKLVRRWALSEKAQLGYYALRAKAERFQPPFIDALVKGKKPGAEFCDAVVDKYPEIAGKITNGSTQGAVKAAIEELASASGIEKEERFIALPTGGGFSISSMLPEPIYIPAVKDLRDETKTAETSPFGKILRIVVDRIEPQLGDAKKLFRELSKQLTRIRDEKGNIADNRLPDVRRVEERMQELLRESFASVSLELEIPPPSIKSVLQTAHLIADDGVKGPLEFKGDGLRRAVVFAILRTYVEFAAEQQARGARRLEQRETKAQADGKLRDQVADASTQGPEPSYLLLFEEPELFLHPEAQRILFEALRTFSDKHHVVVTTHSPLFLGPDATATFVRLSRKRIEGVAKPFTEVRPINLTLGTKDAFQIICFENNSAAFFSKRVVLVEGDSDAIVFPHLARLLKSDWQCAKHSVVFARIQGKGNIRRYRSFFANFGVRVFVISDLDILTDGFEHLEPDAELRDLHQALNKEIDRALAADPAKTSPNSKAIKEAHDKPLLPKLWEKVREARRAVDADPKLFPQLDAAVAEFFAWERKHVRREILEKVNDPNIGSAKSKLLAALRRHDIFVLEKGDLEAYYPAGIAGADKPSRAQNFCKEVINRESALNCCSEVKCPETGAMKPEFEWILEPIFEASA